MSIANDYTDKMPMPFGKYVGKPLADVPASYLIWLYDTSEKGKRLSDKKLSKYIEDNMQALQMEVIAEKQRKYYERI